MVPSQKFLHHENLKKTDPQFFAQGVRKVKENFSERRMRVRFGHSWLGSAEDPFPGFTLKKL